MQKVLFDLSSLINKTHKNYHETLQHFLKIILTRTNSDRQFLYF